MRVFRVPRSDPDHAKATLEAICQKYHFEFINMQFPRIAGIRSKTVNAPAAPLELAIEVIMVLPTDAAALVRRQAAVVFAAWLRSPARRVE